MELEEFTRVLAGMSAIDIHAIAAGLDAYQSSAAAEMDLWHAIFEVDRELRRSHRTRDAAMAALRAMRAVTAAAEHACVALPDTEVTRVARAAADVARGLVAGARVDRPARQLLASWEHLFPLDRTAVATPRAA